MDIQDFVNTIIQAGFDERKKYHVSLGDLIWHLKQNPNAKISYGNPHSYRGYYSDLSFERVEPQLAKELLSQTG